MNNNGKIKVRRLSDMAAEPPSVVEIDVARIGEAPVSSKNKRKQIERTTPEFGEAKASKKASLCVEKEQLENNDADGARIIAATPTKKKLIRSAKKEPLAGQLRIDQFFKSANKSYHIPVEAKSAFCSPKNITPKKSAQKRTWGKQSSATNSNGCTRRQKERRRYFQDTSSETSSTISCLSKKLPKKRNVGTRKTNKQGVAGKTKKISPKVLTQCIDLCSDSEPEVESLLVSGADVNIKDEKTVADTTDEKGKRVVTHWSPSCLWPPKQQIKSANDNLQLVSSKASDKVSPGVSSLINEASSNVGTYTSSATTQSTVSLKHDLNLFKATKETECTPEYKKAVKKTKNTCTIDCSTISKKPIGIRTNMEDIAEKEKSVTTKAKNCNKSKASMGCGASRLSPIKEIINLTEREIAGIKSGNSMHVEAKTELEPQTKAKLTDLTSWPTKKIIEGRGRKARLPPYKVVDGTTFAVDAFRYGQIQGVTHYFLTHFHADHYIGLTRKFSMPLYLSPITARLVRAFIPVEEQYLHEIALNAPLVVNGVEVTAIDANHCPGAIMLLFKLSSGECILHTGDFRASADMESEPIFWNHNIHKIYLDTTYISKKYDFCTQIESIDRGNELVQDFKRNNASKRILFVCGSYMIGKEKFWCEIAARHKLQVWADMNRMKALKAMTSGVLEEHDVLEGLKDRLCDDPYAANMHVISMVTLSYETLVKYLQTYSSYFDVLLAIRPSGWEKNSRPQYRGKVNIVGVEYSEHSSFSELERFVTFLKPNDVISTVPIDRNPLICGQVPQKWYKYNTYPKTRRNFQTSITSYMKYGCLSEAANKIRNLNKPDRDIALATLSPNISPLNSTSSAEDGSPPPGPTGDEENKTPIKKTGTNRLALTDNENVQLESKKLAIAPVKSVSKDLDAEADAVDDWLS